MTKYAKITPSPCRRLPREWSRETDDADLGLVRPTRWANGSHSSPRHFLFPACGGSWI
jgi:hypothetical protein